MRCPKRPTRAANKPRYSIEPGGFVWLREQTRLLISVRSIALGPQAVCDRHRQRPCRRLYS